MSGRPGSVTSADGPAAPAAPPPVQDTAQDTMTAGAPGRRRVLGAVAAGAGAALLPRRARAQGQTFTLKLATVAPEGTPWAEQLQAYRKKVEAESNGRLRIKPFLGGALGDENQTVGECRRGAIPMWGGTTGALATSVPEISLLELPYLFRSADEADHVIDKVLADELRKRLEARGFVLVLWSENGFRSFGSKWGAIKTPADLKGHKMRSQESLVHLETYRALGALPQPIAVTEVLPALQTGVVDGFDNTPLYTFAASWHLAIKHFTLSEHIYQPGAVLVSKKEYDKLPPDLQKVLTSDLGALTAEGRAAVREMAPLLVQNFTNAKIPVHQPSAAEREAFAKATAGVYEKYAKAVPSARPMMAAIKKALGARAGR
jgi:tripartite ATP-independent transporter DctP family solute receptor